jgi:hypothetical protein
MQQVVTFLHIAARIVAVLAVLAGLAAGYLASTFGVGFICFDTCPSREFYFSYTIPAEERLMIPCIVLATLALALFLIYCLATRQPWRALIVLLFFLVGGLVGSAILGTLVLQARNTIPVHEGDFLVEDSAVAWAKQWGLALILVAVVWSGGLAGLEWGRRWSRQPVAE